MEQLKVSENQGVLTVALNRPEKRSAFNPAMIQGIHKIFAATLKQKELRAVVLTGEGESFCAGGDLEWMKSMADYTMKQNIKDAENLFAMFWAIRSCPVPVIGRVSGHAFGGGAGLVAACDIAAAEGATQFSFSEVKWGLVPAVISPFVMERVPPTRVREWFMTAKVFTAPEAQDGGLIGFKGSIGEVDEFVAKTCRALTAAAPAAVRETKKLLQSYSPINWKRAKPQVVRLIAKARSGSEGQFGLKAFLDKKSPQWDELNRKGSTRGAPKKN